MKRKTLYNNLISSNLDKNKIKDAFSTLNILDLSRPEEITVENYVKLYNLLKNN